MRCWDNILLVPENLIRRLLLPYVGDVWYTIQVGDISNQQGGDNVEDLNDDEISGEEVVVSWTRGPSWVSGERWTQWKPGRPDPHPPPARRPPKSRVDKKLWKDTESSLPENPAPARAPLPVNYFRVKSEDGSGKYKCRVPVFEHPCRMARDVPARRQWQSVVRSVLVREE